MPYAVPHGQLPPFDGEVPALLPEDEGVDEVPVVPFEAPLPDIEPVAADVEPDPVLVEDPEVLEEPEVPLLVVLLLEALAAAISEASSVLPRSVGSRSMRSSAHSTREPSERSRLTRTVTFHSPAISACTASRDQRKFGSSSKGTSFWPL